jgi:hypothetical protein
MLRKLLFAFKSRLSERQKQFAVRCLRVILSAIPHNHNLNLLGLEQGTDKWSHGYLKYYGRYFADIRKRKINILEIGVGGYEDALSGGASLRVWQDYFPNATINAIDIYDKSPLQTDRIRIYQGSQNDSSFLKKLATKIGPFHIIIDDGSHIDEHVLTSFQTLFPVLVKDGIYVIEDVSASSLPLDAGANENQKAPLTTMGMLKQLLDGLNYKYTSSHVAGQFSGCIAGIHFYPNIVFIFKGKNVRTANVH